MSYADKEAMIRKARADGKTSMDDARRHELNELTRKLTEAESRIKAFKDATGQELPTTYSWHQEEFAKAYTLAGQLLKSEEITLEASARLSQFLGRYKQVADLVKTIEASTKGE